MQDRSVSQDIRSNPVLFGLIVMIAGLAIIAAAAGLWWSGGNGPITVTSVRGEQVELWGKGLYRHDTPFAAGGQRGTDVIVLTLAVPLLIATAIWSRRGSLRGGFALSSVLGYLLYVYASMALGTVAYNGLFLVYVALFSGTLFALVLAVRSIDRFRLEQSLSSAMPARWPGRFMIFAGLVTLFVWLSEPVSHLLGGDLPSHLDLSSTLVTHALDIAIIVPLALLSGVLLGRGAALGYLIAFPLLGIIVLLGPTFVAQTVSQFDAGVEFTTAEIIGPIGGFGIVALLAIWVSISLFRRVPERPDDPDDRAVPRSAPGYGRQVPAGPAAWPDRRSAAERVRTTGSPHR